MKRLRKPKMKNGELRIYWGKPEHCEPDIVLAWQGDPIMKRDINMLYSFMCSRHPDLFHKPLFGHMNPSMVEELDARGYDLTTLKFSIMKKAGATA